MSILLAPFWVLYTLWQLLARALGRRTDGSWQNPFTRNWRSR